MNICYILHSKEFDQERIHLEEEEAYSGSVFSSVTKTAASITRRITLLIAY
jgi:hypothetical protein